MVKSISRQTIMLKSILKAVENGATTFAEVGELMVVEALKAGASHTDAGAVIGVSRRTAAKISRKYGIDRPMGRPRGRRNNTPRKQADRDKVIIEMLDAGSTLAEIGRKFNISRERVRQIAFRDAVPE